MLSPGLVANVGQAAIGTGAQVLGGSPGAAGGGLSAGQLLGATGGLLAGLGTFSQAQGYAQFNATSAKAARALAAEAPKVAAWQISRLRIFKRQTLASQRFAAALSGVQVIGTPSDIKRLTEQEFLLDERNIYREGQIEKMTQEEAASSYDAAAKANRRSGFLGMVQTGIGIASLVR